jgi:hypothetical protein
VVHVVRVDPRRAVLRAFFADSRGGSKRARRWVRDRRLLFAVNAGMYEADGRTHTGYARVDGRPASRRWLTSYRSVLALRAGEGRLVDLDPPVQKGALAGYPTLIQNLRLLRSPGRNVWQKADRAWSEAAAAEDDRGRLLFLFCRTPLSMPELNRRLLALGLGIVRAMHLEGGPEASLSVHAAGIDVDLNGCLETGFVDSDSSPLCMGQWAIPNVLGVEAPALAPAAGDGAIDAGCGSPSSPAACSPSRIPISPSSSPR